MAAANQPSRHADLFLRCSVHQQTKRSGRIVRAGSIAYTAGRDKTSPREYVLIGRDSLLGALRKDQYAVRFLGSDNSAGSGAERFVTMFSRDAYYPDDEDEVNEGNEAHCGALGVEDGGGGIVSGSFRLAGSANSGPHRQSGAFKNQQETMRLNNPKSWVLLFDPQRDEEANNVAVQINVQQRETFVRICVDVRFIPERIFRISQNRQNSPLPFLQQPENSISSNNCAKGSDPGYFGVALIQFQGERQTLTPQGAPQLAATSASLPPSEKTQKESNHDPHFGTLWRSSYQLGASFISLVGSKFSRKRLSADTSTCWSTVPAFTYPDFNTFVTCAPYNCPIVAIAPGGVPLEEFSHPPRALYAVFANEEDHQSARGIEAINRCAIRVSLPDDHSRKQMHGDNRTAQMSNIVAASIVMYDRLVKIQRSASVSQGKNPANVKRRVVAAEDCGSCSKRQKISSQNSLEFRSKDSFSQLESTSSLDNNQMSHSRNEEGGATSSHSSDVFKVGNSGTRVIVALKNETFKDRVVARFRSLSMPSRDSKLVLDTYLPPPQTILFFRFQHTPDSFHDNRNEDFEANFAVRLANDIIVRPGINGVFYCDECLMCPSENYPSLLPDDSTIKKVQLRLLQKTKAVKNARFRVMSCPGKILRPICENLLRDTGIRTDSTSSESIKLDPKDYNSVASIVSVFPTMDSERMAVFVGVHPSSWNYVGGVGIQQYTKLCRQLRGGKNYLNLFELVHLGKRKDGGSGIECTMFPQKIVGEHLDACLFDFKDKVVLNLGDTKGGWTEFASTMGCAKCVLSVSRSEPELSLRSNGVIKHTNMRAKDVITELSFGRGDRNNHRQSIRDIVSAAESLAGPLDIILGDISCKVLECGKIVAALSKLFRSQSILNKLIVLTTVGGDIDTARLEQIHECGATSIAQLHLFTSKKHERVLVVKF